MYGPEKTILGLCGALERIGHPCRIGLIHRRFAGDPERHPMADLATAQGTPYEELEGRPAHLGRLVLGLRRRLLEGAFDVLHTHDYKADMVGVLATRGWRSRPALVATPRHSESEPLVAALQWIDRGFLRYFDRVTESSEPAVDRLRRSAALRGKTRLVRHGTDPGSFGATGELPTPQPGPVISMVARLFKVKGHDCVLSAVARVAHELPDVQLWLVGDGPLAGDLKHLSDKLGIGSRVHFLGYRHDVDQILRVSQVTVVASAFETSCRTAMEALRLGCPLVATPVGVIPELVGDNEAGLLTPIGDVEAMARTLLRVLTEPGLAERLRTQGLERSRTARSHADAATDMAIVYADAVRERR